MPAPTFVLVHGACHGPYYWAPLIARLERDGYEVVTVDLPSTGSDRARRGDLFADAAAVRAAVEGCASAVVVGHSYGGVPITHGLVGAANVRRLVYLAAFMLAESEALGDVDAGGEDDDWLMSDDGATATVRDPAALFYGQCPPALAASTGRRLRPQNARVFEQPVLRAAWRTIPSTYVICEGDQAIPPHVQQGMSKRAENVRTLASDHTPFLSQPDVVAGLLGELAIT